MAKQRGGKMINNKNTTKFGGGAETTRRELRSSFHHHQRIVPNPAPTKRCRRRRLLSIETSEDKEFGRDTNRLDLFKVKFLDVFEDDHLTRIDNYGGGGGGGGRRDGGVVVSLRPEENDDSSIDNVTAVALAAGSGMNKESKDRVAAGESGGRMHGGVVASGGFQEIKSTIGCRRDHSTVVVPRPEESKDSVTVGAGGGRKNRGRPATGKKHMWRWACM